MTSSGSFQLTSKTKMSSHEFCMFSAIDTTLQKQKNISKFAINQNRIEKLLLVRYLLLLLFRVMVKKLRIFGPHCNISVYTQDYELNISIQINFDTLISNLKSYFQYKIVMTSI